MAAEQFKAKYGIDEKTYDDRLKAALDAVQSGGREELAKVMATWH